MGLFCKFQWGESNWGDGHFIGVVRVLDRVCEKARLADVTPHTLRHTFASLAGDLGVSELMIAALLGHSARGVTQTPAHPRRGRAGNSSEPLEVAG